MRSPQRRRQCPGERLCRWFPCSARYTAILTRDPGSVTEQDIGALREAGLSGAVVTIGPGLLSQMPAAHVGLDPVRARAAQPA